MSIYRGIQTRNENALASLQQATRLCDILHRSESSILEIIDNHSDHYRRFSIEKASGGSREIAAPSDALLELQQILLKALYKATRPRPHVHGGVPKRSVTTFAERHVGQSHVLTMDVQNFFPSITSDMIFKTMKSMGIRDTIAERLTLLCTLDGCLPQGCATSPYLSNLILDQFDWEISRACKKRELTYSRYIDDITISGTAIDGGIKGMVNSSIQRLRLQIAPQKTKLMSRAVPQVVAGLVVNDKLRPSREYVTELSDDIHQCASGEVSIVAARYSTSTKLLAPKINGRLRYLERYKHPRAPRLKAMLYEVKWS